MITRVGRTFIQSHHNVGNQCFVVCRSPAFRCEDVFGTINMWTEWHTLLLFSFCPPKNKPDTRHCPVRMGLSQLINLCNPPACSSKPVPGRRKKDDMYFLKMIWALMFFFSSGCWTAFTVPPVPTGIKNGSQYFSMICCNLSCSSLGFRISFMNVEKHFFEEWMVKWERWSVNCEEWMFFLLSRRVSRLN